MNYAYIKEIVEKYIDKGLFDDIYWYLKDYANYELVIGLEDYKNTEDDIDNTIFDNKLNFYLGSITPDGYVDRDGNNHDIIRKKYSQGHPREDKYDFDMYRSHHKQFKHEIITDLVHARKIEETIMLLLVRNELFSKFQYGQDRHTFGPTFVEDFQECVGKEDDLVYLYLMSKVTYDKEDNYRLFWGVDVDEYDNKVQILSNVEGVTVLEHFKEMINFSDSLNIQSIPIPDNIKSAFISMEIDIDKGNNLTANSLKISAATLENVAQVFQNLISDDLADSIKQLSDGYPKEYTKAKNSRNTSFIIVAHHKLKLNGMGRMNSYFGFLGELASMNILGSSPEVQELIQKTAIGFKNLAFVANYRNSNIHALAEHDTQDLKVALQGYRTLIDRVAALYAAFEGR